MTISLKNAVYPIVATVALALVGWQPSLAVTSGQHATALDALEIDTQSGGDASGPPAAPTAPSAANRG